MTEPVDLTVTSLGTLYRTLSLSNDASAPVYIDRSGPALRHAPPPAALPASNLVPAYLPRQEPLQAAVAIAASRDILPCQPVDSGQHYAYMLTQY